MHILVADDDSITREFLRTTLEGWGYRVSECADGHEAESALRAAPPPAVALLDWMMPGKDGPEVCRALGSAPLRAHTYCILLTSRRGREDVVAGLDAGADDYVTKPFDLAELHARIRAGARLVGLQAELADRVRELEDALTQVRQLKGLLPICCYCKRIRDDHDYWQQIEAYIAEHSEAQFSHGVCPACYDEVVRPQLEALSNRRARSPRPAG